MLTPMLYEHGIMLYHVPCSYLVSWQNFCFFLLNCCTLFHDFLYPVFLIFLNTFDAVEGHCTDCLCLQSLVLCLETQFDSVIVDRPMVLQSLYQLHNCLSDRSIITWEFFLNRFDALFLEAQINLEKSGDIAYLRGATSYLSFLLLMVFMHMLMHVNLLVYCPCFSW